MKYEEQSTHIENGIRGPEVWLGTNINGELSLYAMKGSGEIVRVKLTEWSGFVKHINPGVAQELSEALGREVGKEAAMMATFGVESCDKLDEPMRGISKKAVRDGDEGYA